MNRFEQDKASKLKRLIILRILNAIGMIAWRENSYGCAEQRLRMLHPLSCPSLIVLAFIAIVMDGVVDVVKEIKRLPEKMVWW